MDNNTLNDEIVDYLGDKVEVIANETLVDDYFGLTGQIIQCKQELEQKRNKYGDLKFTGKILKLYQVRFDIDKSNKKIFDMYVQYKICPTLWITRDCFKILEDDYQFKNLIYGHITGGNC